MQFLENEAYKAKLPTLLQSKDRPHIIYSWGGGVLKSQVEAGVLRGHHRAGARTTAGNLAPAPLAAFTVDGKIYGVPHAVSQVGFIYNKELFAKAGVDGAKIKTWDDLLGGGEETEGRGHHADRPSAAPTSGRCTSTGRISRCALGGKAGFEAALRARTAASRARPS